MPVTGSTAPAESGVVSPDDLEFLMRFESCTLPESEWTHLAHLRVAWLCLQSESAGEALQRIRRGILRYNTEVLNRPHKYHETVTVAFTRLVAGRLAAGEPWTGFATRIDDLLDRDAPVLLRYYSPGMLNSDVARATFVEPDLDALPPLAAAG